VASLEPSKGEKLPPKSYSLLHRWLLGPTLAITATWGCYEVMNSATECIIDYFYLSGE